MVLRRGSALRRHVVSVRYDRCQDNAADDDMRRHFLLTKSAVSQLEYSLPLDGVVADAVVEVAALMKPLQDAAQYTFEVDGTCQPRDLPMDELRGAVRVGSVLSLRVLPVTLAAHHIAALRETLETSEVKKATHEASQALKETAVAECFVECGGLSLLLETIRSSSSSANTTGYALHALYLALSSRAGMCAGLSFASEAIGPLYRIAAQSRGNPSVAGSAAWALFALCAPLDVEGCVLLRAAAAEAGDPSLSAVVRSAASENVPSAIAAISVLGFVVSWTPETERADIVHALQTAGLNEVLGAQSESSDKSLQRVVKQVFSLCAKSNLSNSLSRGSAAGVARHVVAEGDRFGRSTRSLSITELTGLAFDDSAAPSEASACSAASSNSGSVIEEQLGTCRIIQPASVVLTGVLGVGSSATVYRAVLEGREVVAVKVLSDLTLSSTDVLQEMAVMASFNSEYVLRLHGVVALSRSAIVMELCEKGCMYDVLRNEQDTLHWPIALRMLTTAARGLLLLHGENIVHHDVKSLNVLVTGNYSCKIADFGSSHRAPVDQQGMLSLATRPQGTLVYCAPEVLMGAKCALPSDVYSFGMVAWEVAHVMDTRKYAHPYQEFSELRFDFQIAVQVSSNRLRPSLSADTPRPLFLLCNKCWQQEPGQRPQMDDVLRTLEESLAKAEKDKTEWTADTVQESRAAVKIRLKRSSRASRSDSVSAVEFE